MNCVIEFSQPYQRFQIRTGFQNVVLPSAAAIAVRNAPRWDDVGQDAESRLDTIDAVRIEGFTDWVECATFMQSLPAGAFSRIARISFSA